MGICAALGLLAAGCGGGPTLAARRPTDRSNATPSSVRLSITPAGGTDATPNRGITVTAVAGRISKVIVRGGSEPITGRLNAAGTIWHSRWALDVSQRYTATATAAGASGQSVTRTSSFRTFTPKATVTAMIIEGDNQSYGVGMPIILYFNRPIANRAAVERALQIRSSKLVLGAWYWDDRCRTAPVCCISGRGTTGRRTRG